MTELVEYRLMPASIDGPEHPPGTEVSLRVLAVVEKLSGGGQRLRVKDWSGPTAEPAGEVLGVIETPGVLGRAAQAALTAAVALGRFEGQELERAFVLVFSPAGQPPVGMAALADGQSDREVHRHLFDMLLSATRQMAERAGVPFTVAAIPAGQG